MAKSVNLYARIEPDVMLPNYPLDISCMTATQLDAELEKGYADMQAGHTIPLEQAFADIRKEFDL